MSSPVPSQCSFSSQSSLQSDDDQGMFFDDLYDLSVFLHKGQFGDTYRCLEKDTGAKYAVKILPPITKKPSGSKYSNSDVKFSREGAIWRRLKHRNIVELFRVFNTPNEQFLVTEYVRDGKLFDHITHLHEYTEREVCFYTKQLLEALAYLRRKRVIHRSITTESILVEQNESGDIVKIGDLSLALRLERGQKYIKTAPQGVPLYLSPETILEKPINYGVDTWSVGIVLYALLVGSPPFWKDRLDALYADILTKPIDVISNLWKSVSNEAKDLLKCLLEKDAEERITVEDALNHPWFDKPCKFSGEHQRKSIDRLKEFNTRRKSRGNLFTVQSVFPGEKGVYGKDMNNNNSGIIKSFGEMRRRKMFVEEQKQNGKLSLPNSSPSITTDDTRKVTVFSQTKTVDLSKHRSKSKVCINFQPKKVLVQLNTNYNM